ncbi:ATP-binding protein [Undibacterium cyanobacteriorum]|uniref:histidine kinase n=1 Tax=Undibacterium cyanobacteriorum TaxID=3073561 RepID=A0ABY9RIE8_9BURK|nr:ATP-binding protein [Undibacterium sp. 20NA77.5]WMW80445.1 ATP-binding protein [Undibacterium sp. 20NA77.5]
MSTKLRPINSISTRIFAILILGVLAAAALTWWLAFGERQSTISHERNNFRNERSKHTEQLIRAIDELPAANRDGLLRSMPRLGLQIYKEAAPQSQYQPSSSFALALVERLDESFPIIALAPSPANCLYRPDADKNSNEGCEALLIQLRDGMLLKLSLTPPRAPTPPIQTETLYYLGLFLTCVAGLAFFVSRMTIKPLLSLAQAATELGQDINRPPLPERGANEILLASRAFNAMQNRIRSHIQQRTQMLAAITHDLQTPLTRLRLRLEKVNDQDLRDKLILDLSNMQMMVKEGLDLARSMDSAEELRPLDIDSMLDSICSDASDAGHKVSFSGESKATIMARPQALRRCLDNLIDNGIKYGQSVEVTVRREETRLARSEAKNLCIVVRDHGPGIPEDQQARVFEPFYRIETSRSRETGGTGLGLTIALNIVRQHNGDLQLSNHAEGGLEVRLLLPIKS